MELPTESPAVRSYLAGTARRRRVPNYAFNQLQAVIAAIPLKFVGLIGAFVMPAVAVGRAEVRWAPSLACHRLPSHSRAVRLRLTATR